MLMLEGWLLTGNLYLLSPNSYINKNEINTNKSGNALLQTYFSIFYDYLSLFSNAAKPKLVDTEVLQEVFVSCITLVSNTIHGWDQERRIKKKKNL